MGKRIFGLTLIAGGVLVWIVYAALKTAGVSVNVGIALAIHLAFVIPGALLAPGENFYGKLIAWIRHARNNSTLTGEQEK